MGNYLELVFGILSAITVIGGITIVVLKLVGDSVVKGLVEKFKSSLQKELEIQKTKLKKSEFLFQKQFEAASTFSAMKRGILPRYSTPDMDWSDACDELARNFGSIETQLNQFLAEHGAILSRETLDKIEHAMGISAQNKFETDPLEISSAANDEANGLWDALTEIEEILKDEVFSQSSI